jgi:hypothetical protein
MVIPEESALGQLVTTVTVDVSRFLDTITGIAAI